MIDLVETFINKATLVSARVTVVKTRAAALEQAVALLAVKPPLELQMPNPGQKTADGDSLRIMAAPGLDDDDLNRLSGLCDAAGNITLLRKGMRDWPGGIDLGLTLADFGIAETGTLVIRSDREDVRLATMLCEVHVAILDIADIRDTALSMADELAAVTGRQGAYTAFITGASRTADIERVLAIGVHGPLELHIILVKGE
ncbi:MAG TPA: lactate utilization protein [Desulfotignum sp.]|nr:lactate utilization protein [Desulfotignum sp.]